MKFSHDECLVLDVLQSCPMSAVFNHQYFGWYGEQENTFDTTSETRVLKVTQQFIFNTLMGSLFYNLVGGCFPYEETGPVWDRR